MSQKTVTEPGTRIGAHQLATLLDSTQELIAILGLDGTVLFANGAFRNSLGYNPDELLGHSIHALVHAIDVEHIRERLQEVAAVPGSSVRERCRLRTRDCSWRWFELVCHNRLEDSGIEGILLNAQDVTLSSAWRPSARLSPTWFTPSTRRPTSTNCSPASTKP